MRRESVLPRHLKVFKKFKSKRAGIFVDEANLNLPKIDLILVGSGDSDFIGLRDDVLSGMLLGRSEGLTIYSLKILRRKFSTKNLGNKSEVK